MEDEAEKCLWNLKHEVYLSLVSPCVLFGSLEPRGKPLATGPIRNNSIGFAH
jgi:hypothetical protein